MKDVIKLSSGFFRKTIYLACTEKALGKFISKHKVMCDFPDGGFDGAMGLFNTKNGGSVFLIYCKHDAGVVTLVHELSHAVDEIFQCCGVDTGIGSTETRAYLLDSLLEQSLDGGFGKGCQK